jgi:hypothetical protein
MYHQKRACSHREHDQRTKVVIVWLTAQRPAFLHLAEASHSAQLYAFCNLAKLCENGYGSLPQEKPILETSCRAREVLRR